MFDFSNHLKTLRINLNLTQKDLANATGLSVRGIQNYETSMRKPTYDVLIVLADYFNVSIDYLVGRTDNPEINR